MIRGDDVVQFGADVSLQKENEKDMSCEGYWYPLPQEEEETLSPSENRIKSGVESLQKRKRGRPSASLSSAASTSAVVAVVPPIVEEIYSDSIAVRKTQRNPALSMLERRDVQNMVDNIRKNDSSTVVFKVKEHVFADINSMVFDAIVDALAVNKVCQAIYIQNLSNAIHDDQVRRLINVLKKKKIWCVNIGENYEVSTKMWEEFCRRLPETFVTHLYVSEHVIPLSLKNLMREHIRNNRKKHQLHCAYKNLSVIERCTNMWWNPINGVKELKPYVPPPPPSPEPAEVEPDATEIDDARALLMKERAKNPKDVLYWQQGVGKGGEKPWRFKCLCGEECSSYENYRYHPTGRMFECSVCHLWSHVDCVFGENKVSDDDLEEMEEVLCRPCQNRYRRTLKRLSDDGLVSDIAVPTATSLLAPLTVSASSSSANKRTKHDASDTSVQKQATKETAPYVSKLDDSKPWKFKCLCGEVCSSYEKKLYQPKGAIYACSKCELRCHVLCMLGPQVTQEQADAMKDLLCGTCRSKNRRSSRGVVVIESPAMQTTLPVAITSSGPVDMSLSSPLQVSVGQSGTIVALPTDVTEIIAIVNLDTSTTMDATLLSETNLSPPAEQESVSVEN